MQRWIRRYLGIDEIQEDQGLLNRRLRDVEGDLRTIKAQATAANLGMGRLIAKLDPRFGQDELDPQRKADSDRITNDIIKKLIAEHVASNKPNV